MNSESRRFDGRLAPSRVLAALGAQAARFDVQWCEECASTNSALMDAPAPPAGSPVRVLGTVRQTAGRGRRGNVWQSWAGASLTFSVRWQFAAQVTQPAGLSLLTGLALARALEHFGLTEAKLKWPNDVLVQGGKLAGILIELPARRAGEPLCAVIGIGLNLDLPPNTQIDGQTAVASLAQHLPALPDEHELLARILLEMAALFEHWQEAGFAPFRAAWQQRDAFDGQPVRLFDGQHEIVGRSAGVDDDGALLLDTGAGVQRILAGELSLRSAS